MSTLNNLKATLQSWNTTTLQCNLLDMVIYALIGALCFWFLIAMYYDFKNTRLKKHSQKLISGIDQERLQISATLDNTALQLFQSEQQRTQTEQTLALKQQRNEELEEAIKLAQVKINHGLALESQITAALSTLPTEFFASESTGAENTSSWQRYHNAVNDLNSRLKIYAQDQLQLQQEKTALNTALQDSARTIKTLQQKESANEAQISQLEQIIDDIQSQLKAQQHLSPPTTIAINEPITQPSSSFIETADHALDNITQQAEEVIEDVVTSLKSAFQAETPVENSAITQQPAPPESFGSNQFSTTPTEATAPSTSHTVTTVKASLPAPKVSKLKSLFSFGKKSTSAPIIAAKTIPDSNTAIPPPTPTTSDFVESADPLLDNITHPVAEVIEDVVPSLKSAFQPATPAIEAAIKPSAFNALPTNIPNKTAADAPLQSTPKKLWGFFNKDAITDYIDNALEKNDAIVAEEKLAEELKTNINPKSFWRKISFSKD